MHKNYTLKQSVKTAIAILTMSAQTNALALGLGNINVNSHLGQPLRASIKVQGASELKNIDCFSAVNDNGAVNQLESVNFKLSKSVDDVAILTVTTNQVLNEPIMSLSIAAECDTKMRRDYVLLLDPPLTTDVEKETEVSSTEAATNIDNVAEDSAYVTTKAPQTLKVVKVSNKSSPTQISKKEIVLTAGYSNTKATDIAKAHPNDEARTANKPRLSISGGEAAHHP